ncbi:MAG TPA: hypothetical protein VFI60_05685 [Candidatus Acidoferrum sp.]|nr:hypothetical protein [Candidatus Acidoferrum sp.]
MIILRPEDFGKAAKTFSGVPTNVGFSVGDRSYINAALFNPKNTLLQDELRGMARVGASDAPEWVLAHEATHMSSRQDPQLQEMHDDLYNDDANAIIGQWNSKPARAYRTVQDISAKLPGEFEPSHAPLRTDLTPPQPSAAPNATPAPSPMPPSQPNGLFSLETLGQHIPAAILGALGHAASQPPVKQQ